MIPDIILTIGALVLCFWIIAKWHFTRSSNIPLRQLFLFFTIQLCASLSLYFIYTQIYSDRLTADIFKFYDDANILYNELFATSPKDYFKLIIGIENSEFIQHALEKTSFWYKPFETHLYNDNQTIIRLNLLIRLFSFGSYGVHAVLFTFLSYLGLIAIFKTFQPFFSDKLFLLKTACFLIPSVIFWTSGILKESLLIFGLGLFIYQISNICIFNQFSFKRLLLSLIFASLLLITKPYVLGMLIPGILAFIFWRIRIFKILSYTFLIASLIILIPTLILGEYTSFFDLTHVLVKMQKDFINVAHLSNAGSAFEIRPLHESVMSIIINTPEALFNVLFRPFFLSGTAPIILIASCENLFILVVMIYAFSHRIKLREDIKGLWLICLALCLYLFIIIGLTVPVEGAIVRYKVPALPFLLILFFSITDTTHLKQLKDKLYPLWIKKLLS
jgi:hypothetical protein